MNWQDDFMSMSSNAFSEMRLLVEGAITLFEDDTSVLCSLARDAEKPDALGALDDIGAALYSIRTLVCQLQEEYRKELQQQSQLHA